MDGEGSENSPYVVTDTRELQAIEENPDASYELGTDIDASGTSEWNDGAGFDPITAFTGSLDGRGYTIRNLRIQRPTEEAVGLFSTVEGTVEDLSVVDAEVQGQNAVAVLAGWATDASLKDIDIRGAVEGGELVGGLVGYCDVSTGDSGDVAIDSCRADCRVQGDTRVGGLLGHVSGGYVGEVVVTDCVTNGRVAGNETVGGFVGAANHTVEGMGVVIEECSANSSVESAESARSRFGGFAGGVHKVTVRDVTARGSIDASQAERVGGLVGQTQHWKTTVRASSATGVVDGGSVVGGIVGHGQEGVVQECYADSDVTGSDAVGGIVGGMAAMAVRDVYAGGAVTGEHGVGGVVGAGSSNVVTRALATGAISGTEAAGGIVGEQAESTLSSTYWDTEATGLATSPGAPDENGVPTGELQGDTATSTLVEFDFDEVWTTREGKYPTLRASETEVEGSGGTAWIRNLRLVQTVENSRVLSAEAEGESHLQAAPVAEEIVRDETDSEIEWTAPEADFAAKRLVAPAFDLQVDRPDAISEPLSLTGRLHRDGEVVREWQSTLAPDAVAGNDRIRGARIAESWQSPVPDQLPLLETLVENPGAVGGDYPLFHAGAGSALELEFDGPDLARSVTVHHSIDRERVRALPPLSVGIVGLEGLEVDTDVTYTFDDVDLTAFAEDVADYLVATYPVRSVRTAVRREPLTKRGQFSTTHSAAVRAANSTSGSLEEFRVVRHTADDRREDAVDAVDVTVGVVPEEFFDDGRAGTVPVVDGRPVAAAVLVELGDAEVAAHELAHYFLGDHFTDPAVSADDDSYHASIDLTSTGYDVQSGEFEVLPGKTSLMAYTTDRWMDTHSYQGLIDSRLDPAEAPPREVASSFLSTILADSREQLRSLQKTPQETVDGLSIDAVSARLERQVDTVAETVESIGHHWEIPDLPDQEFWRGVVDTAVDLETIGAALQRRDVRYLDERGETTRTVGERLEVGAAELGGRAKGVAERVQDGGVDFALDVRGRVRGGTLEVEADVVPVLGDVVDFDGPGTVAVDNGDGETLTSHSLATTTGLLDSGRESTSSGNEVAGVARLPDEAASVEVAIPGEDTTLVASFDPVTDSLQKHFEELPDEAFVDAATREEISDSLDVVADHVTEGDRRAASEELGTLRERLADGIRTDYTPSGGAPTKAEVLSIVEMHESRLEPDDTGRGWLVPGVLGGLTCSGLGLYLRRRRGEE